MSVYRRQGSPFYYCDFIVRGRRVFRSTCCTTEREARKEERRIRKEVLEAIRQAAPGLAITLDRGFERYHQEHGPELSAKWAAEIDRYAAKILMHVNPHLPLEQLSDVEVNDFVQAMRREGTGPYAVNRALAAWRGMHSWARRKWKQRCQVIDWTDHMAKEEKRVRWITPEEAQRLCTALDKIGAFHITLAVEWSLYTGCREAETYSLGWDYVHMDRGYAIVRAKGGKEHTIWLSEQALDVLARRGRYGLSGELVFNRRNQRRLFERGLLEAGIEDFCWHDLRHTHATWLRQAGAVLEIVQRSLGHAALETTARYAHVADPELVEALRRLPSLSPSAAKIVRHPAAKSSA